VKRAVKKANSSRNITGAAIRRIRLLASPKVTQEDMVGRLARLDIQINQSQVAKIENGERPVLDYELAAFAKALRVPVQTFFEA
jgi:transcriptional regulator with XRE-family HTH domain